MIGKVIYGAVALSMIWYGIKFSMKIFPWAVSHTLGFPLLAVLISAVLVGLSMLREM